MWQFDLTAHVVNNFRRLVSIMSKMFRDVLETDRLCGLVVGLPGCRLRGPGVRFPGLEDFPRSSGSGTDPLSPCEEK
jgi:hypothetical protein